MQQQTGDFSPAACDDGDVSCAHRHQRMPDVPFPSRGARLSRQLAAAAAVRTVTLAALRTAGSALRSVRKNPLSFPIATRLEAQQEVDALLAVLADLDDIVSGKRTRIGGRDADE